jgi:hypothetical protein
MSASEDDGMSLAALDFLFRPPCLIMSVYSRI